MRLSEKYKLIKAKISNSTEEYMFMEITDRVKCYDETPKEAIYEILREIHLGISNQYRRFDADELRAWAKREELI